MNVSNSRTIRKRARMALKGNWQTALLVTLGAGIFGLILSAIQLSAIFSATPGINLYNWISEYAMRRNSYEGLTTILSIFGIIFSSALAIGLNYYFLQLHRGQEAGFSLLFSRMPIFWKCIGQLVMIYLLVFLWTLLLVAPLYILFIIIRVRSSWFTMLLIYAAAIPGIMAAFRYAMAPYLLAEDPDMGIMDSIRQSKVLMDGSKGRLFALRLSFLGWFFLTVVLIIVLAWQFKNIGIVVGMFISLMVQVYIFSANAAFYLELIGQSPQPEEAPKEQASLYIKP